jgi:hypothetical protein
MRRAKRKATGTSRALSNAGFTDRHPSEENTETGDYRTMTKLRTLAFGVVVAHWIDAIWHLFLAARILPAPNNTVGSPGITFITLGHLALFIVIWKLSARLSGLISLIFFLLAMAADLYEHFIQAAPNNVFMVAPGEWRLLFDVSVFLLLALEILGCCLGIASLGGKRRNNYAASLNEQRPKPGEPPLGPAGLRIRTNE